jgi:hypothetical protein
MSPWWKFAGTITEINMNHMTAIKMHQRLKLQMNQCVPIVQEQQLQEGFQTFHSFKFKPEPLGKLIVIFSLFCHF